MVIQQSPGVRDVLGDLAAAASNAGDIHVVVRSPATARGRVDENTREAVVTAWSGGKLAYTWGPGPTEGLLEALGWFVEARGVPLRANRPRNTAAQPWRLHLWAPAELVATFVELGIVESEVGVEPPDGAPTNVVDGPSPTFAVLIRDNTALQTSVRELARPVPRRRPTRSSENR